MSKKRNRAKLNKATFNKEYNKIMKSENLYCYICAKRGGSYTASCHPNNFNKKGFKYRQNRSWKHNRLTQWKTIKNIKNGIG